MFEIQIDGFEEMIKILGKRKQKSDFEIKDQGHLVLMNCGHRGRPSR